MSAEQVSSQTAAERSRGRDRMAARGALGIHPTHHTHTMARERRKGRDGGHRRRAGRGFFFRRTDGSTFSTELRTPKELSTLSIMSTPPADTIIQITSDSYYHSRAVTVRFCLIFYSLEIPAIFFCPEALPTRVRSYLPDSFYIVEKVSRWGLRICQRN